jgi:type II secretory pathway pseudopilin PulG
MKRGVVITIIVVFTVIIISVVAYLVYKSSKNKSSKEIAALQQQLANLQNQANSPSTTPEEKQTILSQIAVLTQTLKDSGVGSNLFGGKETTTVIIPPVVTQVVTPAVQPPGFPLKKAKGYNPLVENLQKGLNKKCNSGLNADGKFGDKTEAALYKCYNVNEANFELYNNIIS